MAEPSERRREMALDMLFGPDGDGKRVHADPNRARAIALLAGIHGVPVADVEAALLYDGPIDPSEPPPESARLALVLDEIAAAERRGAEAQRASDLRKIFLFAASEQTLGFEDTVRVLNEVGDIIRAAPLATPPPDPWQRALSLDEALAIGTEIKARAVTAIGVGFDPAAGQKQSDPASDASCICGMPAPAADVRAAAEALLPLAYDVIRAGRTNTETNYKLGEFKGAVDALRDALGRRLIERGGRTE